jgi:hypothetical protein
LVATNYGEIGIVGSVADVRPLTPDERRLLEWLLNHGTAEAEKYLEQLPGARVVSRCSCGCPTIAPAVGDRAAKASSPSTILAEGLAVSPEGVHVGIIVHGREGLISELEIYPIGEETEPFSLPRIDDLEAA